MEQQKVQKTAKEWFIVDHDDWKQRNGKVTKLVVAVQLPNGSVEIIVNTETIEEKFRYYMNTYDENMCLKSSPKIKILNWMFV